MWDDEEPQKPASPVQMIIGVGTLLVMAAMFAVAGDIAMGLLRYALR